MCTSARNVDVLVYSDVFLLRKSYMYKLSVGKTESPSEFGLWFNIPLKYYNYNINIDVKWKEE